MSKSSNAVMIIKFYIMHKRIPHWILVKHMIIKVLNINASVILWHSIIMLLAKSNKQASPFN